MTTYEGEGGGVGHSAGGDDPGKGLSLLRCGRGGDQSGHQRDDDRDIGNGEHDSEEGRRRTEKR